MPPIPRKVSFPRKDGYQQICFVAILRLILSGLLLAAALAEFYAKTCLYWTWHLMVSTGLQTAVALLALAIGRRKLHDFIAMNTFWTILCASTYPVAVSALVYELWCNSSAESSNASLSSCSSFVQSPQLSADQQNFDESSLECVSVQNPPASSNNVVHTSICILALIIHTIQFILNLLSLAISTEQRLRRSASHCPRDPRILRQHGAATRAKGLRASMRNGAEIQYSIQHHIVCNGYHDDTGRRNNDADSLREDAI